MDIKYRQANSYHNKSLINYSEDLKSPQQQQLEMSVPSQQQKQMLVEEEKFARKLSLKLKSINDSIIKIESPTTTTSSSSSSSDSDFYYDFGVTSPIESPTENNNNNLDDKDLLLLDSGSSCGGVESGYVVSSTTTPPPTTLPLLFLLHGSAAVVGAGAVGVLAAEDGGSSSEASDNSSIYYDVESGSLTNSPKNNTFVFNQDNDHKILQEEKVVQEDAIIIIEEGAEKEEIVVGAKEEEIVVKELIVVVKDVDEEEEFSNNNNRLHRIQRSSSLKSGKTPPGTPGRKKIVRFADVLGLDLADVRTFLDEIPNVPISAFKDLTEAMESAAAISSNATVRKSSLLKTLLPSFHQPVTMPDFFDKIRDQKVLLENAFLIENFTIKGTVRVKNMDFHKSVYLRFTYNDWENFIDFKATYVVGSCDGFSDRFEFTFPLNSETILIGGRVCFACRFHCQGQQFWDNNSGRNYIFHCVPSTTSVNNHDYYQQNHSNYRMWM